MRHVLCKSMLVGIFLMLCISANAQVTIGSGVEPRSGVLLDLKENNTDAGANSTKGLMMPRIQLTQVDLLEDIPDATSNASGANVDVEELKYTGLTVYNIGGATGTGVDAEVAKPGVYVWDGTKWVPSVISGSGSGSGGGAIIPYSSGVPMVLLSADLLNIGGILGTDQGTVNVMQTVGFGLSEAINVSLLGGDVNLLELTGTGNSTLLSNAFIAPRDATLGSFYASLDIVAGVNTSALNNLLNALKNPLGLGGLLALLGIGIDDISFSIDAILYGEMAKVNPADPTENPRYEIMGRIPLLFNIDTADGTQDGIIPFSALAVQLTGNLAGNTSSFANADVVAGRKYVLTYKTSIITTSSGSGLLDFVVDMITQLLSANAVTGYASAGVSM